MARLKQQYVKTIAPKLKADLGVKNFHQVPQLEKVVVSMGLGEAVSTPKAIENAERDLTIITGQKPVITKAKKAISNFKLREGQPIGLKVTLRGDKMYEFVDLLANAVLPRIRDFRGIPIDSFDGQGNYSLGIKEHLVFPELVYDEVDKARGLEITIVTSTYSDEHARALIIALGFPLRDLKEQK
ncbi:MAG: 50S ribosomal protein L5 [bacterium]|jgi:large subunit ribosomal protein L5